MSDINVEHLTLNVTWRIRGKTEKAIIIPLLYTLQILVLETWGWRESIHFGMQIILDILRFFLYILVIMKQLFIQNCAVKERGSISFDNSPRHLEQWENCNFNNVFLGTMNLIFICGKILKTSTDFFSKTNVPMYKGAAKEVVSFKNTTTGDRIQVSRLQSI